MSINGWVVGAGVYDYKGPFCTTSIYDKIFSTYKEAEDFIETLPEPTNRNGYLILAMGNPNDLG